MKKSFALSIILALGLITACTTTEQVPSGQIDVDGPAITSDSLNSNASARFEVYVGASAVRIDASDLDNEVAGSLLLRVYDSNNVLYAQTTSRRYFIAPKPEIFAGAAAPQWITIIPAYSINIPAGSGKMYFEVTNLAADPTQVSVKAVSRAPLPYTNDVFNPTPTDFNGTAIGALIFLGQTDVWHYTGSARVFVSLAGGQTVHATARIVGGGIIKANLEPGESYFGLENGDLIYVQAQGNGATAGFCTNLSGCNDGLDSGEYQLITALP